MSILDELLVAIDDQTEMRIDQIRELYPQYSYQTLSAALGRLTNWGWLVKNDGPVGYRVSQTGNDYINQTLDAIRLSEKSWNGSWFAAAVRLPEDGRKLRDRLRHYFIGQGYGRFIDSLWISPWNRQTELSPVIREYEAGTYVFMFETQPFGLATNQIIIQQAWDWPALTAKLNAFVPDFDRRAAALPQLSQQIDGPGGRLRLRLAAKNLVFDYGALLHSGPNLPADLSLTHDTDKTLRAIYERVRPYCYQ